MCVCHTVISPELVMEVEARMKRNYLPPSMQPKQPGPSVMQVPPQYQNNMQVHMQQLQNNFQQLQFVNPSPKLSYQPMVQSNQGGNFIAPSSLGPYHNISIPTNPNNSVFGINNGYNVGSTSTCTTNLLSTPPSVASGIIQNQPQRKYSSHGPHRCKLQTLATVQELGKYIYTF